MTALLSRIHARIGDLWWYSAMIFVACRIGDVINAFVGLWLVPKYVGPQELGAVLPLQQLTSFLTVPLGIIAIVFAKQVNTYAAHGELGKVKGFIRDVLGITAILFGLCILGAYFIMPYFYDRLHIASGLLTALILASGFATSLNSLVTSALQGLKRFKTITVMNLIGAPIRLVTMLVAMPVRALSGYMLGQTTPSLATTALSAFDVHRTLRPHVADTSWRKDWPRIWRYFLPVAIYTAIGVFNATLHATVYRQRLPEMESAAYYLFSRFAEMAGYFGASIIVILFPLASESHESGKDNGKILRHSVIGVTLCTLLLTLLFTCGKELIVNATPLWKTYSDYSYILPWLTITNGTGSIIGIFLTFEMANNRFNIIMPVQILNVAFAFFIVSFSGYSFFDGILPAAAVDFMRWADIAHLNRLVYIGNAWNLFQLAVFFILYKMRKQ